MLLNNEHFFTIQAEMKILKENGERSEISGKVLVVVLISSLVVTIGLNIYWIWY